MAIKNAILLSVALCCLAAATTGFAQTVTYTFSEPDPTFSGGVIGNPGFLTLDGVVINGIPSAVVQPAAITPLAGASNMSGDIMRFTSTVEFDFNDLGLFGAIESFSFDYASVSGAPATIDVYETGGGFQSAPLFLDPNGPGTFGATYDSFADLGLLSIDRIGINGFAGDAIDNLSFTLAGTSPSGVVEIIERGNDYRLEFTDTVNFTDALADLKVNQRLVADLPGASRDLSFGLTSTSTILSWESISPGSLHVAPYIFVPGDPGIVSTTVTLSTSTLSEAVLHTQLVPGDVFLFVGDEGDGRSYLQVQSSSPGALDDDNPYIWEMLIPGDWSDLGIGPGQTELVAINEFWTINDYFVFDGINTKFSAYQSNYFNDAGLDIDIDFILHGVPEPSSLVLFMGGLACVIKRRRKVEGQ